MNYVISWAVLIVYLLLMLYIGYWAYVRTKTLEDYYVSGRSFGPWVIAFAFFGTYFSTSSMLGGGGSGFAFGFQWSAWLALFHIIGAIIAWFVVAPRMREYSERLNSLTIPDFLQFRYDSRSARLVAAVLLIFFNLFYMISIYKGTANLFEGMLGIPYIYGLFISVIPVAMYTAFGGFKAVNLTDFVQGIIMVVGAVMLFVLLLVAVGGWSAGIEKATAHTIANMPGTVLIESGKLGPPPAMQAGMVSWFILSLTFSISIVQVCSPQLVVKFYQAKNQKVVSRGMILGPLLVGSFAVLVFSVGPFGWAVIPELVPPSGVAAFMKDPDKVIPFLIMHLFPPGVNAVILAAILSAAMSTISGVLIVTATSLGRDIVQALRPGMSPKRVVGITQWAAVLFAVIPLLLAIRPPGIIVTIVGLAFGAISAAFMAPMVLGLFWKGGTAAGTISSMIIATLVTIYWQLVIYPKLWIHPVLPGLVASFVVYLGVSAVTKKPPVEVTDMVGSTAPSPAD